MGKIIVALIGKISGKSAKKSCSNIPFNDSISLFGFFLLSLFSICMGVKSKNAKRFPGSAPLFRETLINPKTAEFSELQSPEWWRYSSVKMKAKAVQSGWLNGVQLPVRVQFPLPLSVCECNSLTCAVPCLCAGSVPCPLCSCLSVSVQFRRPCLVSSVPCPSAVLSS